MLIRLISKMNVVAHAKNNTHPPRALFQHVEFDLDGRAPRNDSTRRDALRRIAVCTQRDARRATPRDFTMA